jgi:hypothetical protein
MVNSSFFTDGPVNEGAAVAPPAPAAFYADPTASAASAGQAADSATAAAASATAAAAAAASAVAASIGKADVNSPTFTGVPAAPTPSNGDNSTRLATTAWVQANAVGSAPATAAPVMDGTAAVGASAKYAREDHVHPTDTSRASVAYVNAQIATVATVSYVDAQDATKAPLASPALTGVPTAPTPTAGDNSTKIATTAHTTTAINALAFRKQITAAISVYVNASTGSDSNNGLSAGTAFATIQKGIDYVCSLDVSIFGATIGVADGTYAPFTLKTFVGAASCNIIGNTTTWGNVVVSGSGSAISTGAQGCSWNISGMRLQSSGAQDVQITTGCQVSLDKIEFAGSSTIYRVYVSSLGNLTMTGSYRVYAVSCLALVAVEVFAKLICNGSTWTFMGNCNFTGVGTIYARSVGYIEVTGSTWNLNGFTVSGPRYVVTSNSIIAGTSGVSTFFPGSTAGSATAGGIYS